MTVRNTTEPVMDRRRRLLVQALSTGMLVGGLGWNRAAMAEWFGRVPGELPRGKSIFRLRGDVRVNGEPADPDTPIGPDDHVVTGYGSELVAVIGPDAFILRPNAEVRFSLGERVEQGLRLLTGALLSVFGEREEHGPRVSTPTAAVGIRGTGLYVEAGPTRSYICNCYGEVDIVAGEERETIVSRHHDDPRWVLAERETGQRIQPAPFINHADMELVLLESLVGREVPFGAPGRSYRRRRRNY